MRDKETDDSNLARVLAGKAVLTGQIWEMLYRWDQISTWVGKKPTRMRKVKYNI